MADDNELDPYYSRKSRRDSQEILFWLSMVGAAMLCIVVGAHFLEQFGFIHLPDWAR